MIVKQNGESSTLKKERKSMYAVARDMKGWDGVHMIEENIQ